MQNEKKTTLRTLK